MAVPSIIYQQFLDSNGLPRAGGKVYTYAAGTTTPKATFTSADASIQAQNPVVLNASGEPDHGSGNVGMIWIQGSYDFVVTNADGTDPITVPNVTSFNTIANAGDSYFQSWSGDGTTSTFTLSEPLGTDENSVLFFIDNGRPDYVTNGDFSTDTVWTKGTGWTISGGVATATGAISTAISQNANTTLNAGQSYTVTYTITRTAGTITPNIGGTDGTARSASGTFTETIIAGSTQLIAFNTAAFTGTLDLVSVKPVQGMGFQFIPPTQFTLNNTSVTFASAPKTGTNNIVALAPSTLVAAASASAAAAEAFANAANVSATNAAASATVAQAYAQALTSTSTTSNLIDVGSKSFTTQPNKQYMPGQFMSVVSAADSANYMHGNVVSYDSTTGALVLLVTDIGGSGTYTDWNLSISGSRGAPGTLPTQPANSITANRLSSSGPPTWLNIGANQIPGRASTGNLVALTVGGGLSISGTNITAPIVDSWVAWTPTFTGFGTVTGVTAMSRRNGSILEWEINFTAGTPTAVEARISLGYNGVDSSVTSASDYPNVTNVTGGMAALSTVGSPVVFVLIERSVSYMTFGYTTGSAAALNKSTGNAMVATGARMSIRGSCRIQGW